MPCGSKGSKGDSKFILFILEILSVTFCDTHVGIDASFLTDGSGLTAVDLEQKDMEVEIPRYLDEKTLKFGYHKQAGMAIMDFCPSLQNSNNYYRKGYFN